MVLLAEQQTLLTWCAAIEEFLELRLQLALRPETTIPIKRVRASKSPADFG